MKTTLNEKLLKDVMFKLTVSNTEHKKHHPGDRDARQPAHTVYGGAHLFKSNTTQRIGELALKGLKDYAPDATSLGAALDIPSHLTKAVFERVQKKLTAEAVEDFRIDFEDGFGNRPDKEEDETAVNAATEVAKGMKEGTLSPYLGIRIKTFSEELKHRGIRTLDIFVSTLTELTGGKLPSNFVVTLPKVISDAQVSALSDIFDLMEKNSKLAPGSLKMEFMVETTESILGPRGECPMLGFVEAARGRCVAAHFGTYDYTASNNITAKYQAMDHAACDFAKNFMKVSLAGTGVWLSDGATNVMPVGPHKGTLTKAQEKENLEVVHRAWKLSYDHIRHSLKNAYYQGWDLHPNQLPVRYAALYTFFLEGLESASSRLKNFMEQAAKATLLGDVFDDAATGQGLLNYFLKAQNCGAIAMDEILATGLTLEEIRTRSFAQILKMRREKH